MKKISLLFACLLLMFIKTVYAQDIEFSCDESSCSTFSSIVLFSSSLVWYPGKSISKTIRIRNNSNISQIIGTKANNSNTTGNLDHVIFLSVVKVSTNTVVWTGSLYDFYNTGEINLTTFSPNTFNDFVYTVSMSQTADNSYQNKKTEFNLVIGFLQAPTDTPLPTNTPTPTIKTETSTTMTISTSGIASSIVGVASNLTQKVLGKSTTEAQLTDIKRNTTQVNQTIPSYKLYLWIILFILILLLLLYLYLRKKHQRKR